MLKEGLDQNVVDGRDVGSDPDVGSRQSIGRVGHWIRTLDQDDRLEETVTVVDRKGQLEGTVIGRVDCSDWIVPNAVVVDCSDCRCWIRTLLLERLDPSSIVRVGSGCCC